MATHTIVRTGRFEPDDAPDWHLVPIDVPSGVRRLDVAYSYNRPAPPPGGVGNVLDIGIFGPAGADLDNAEGFRGYSGGARSAFSISRSEATPGYIPGAVSPGRWQILLGPYTVAPGGLDWRVQVTLAFGQPGPAFEPARPPTAVPGIGPGWYRGDLHLHTVHSDGRRTPDRLAREARAAGLDFIVSSEHNTRSAHDVWGRYAPDDLLVVLGEEVTTRSGHWVAAGLPAGTWIDWRYRAGESELPRLAERVRRLGGLAIAAHPYATPRGTRWEHGYDDIDAIEVWNGPWIAHDEAALERWHELLVAGRRLPVVGSSDSHTLDDVVGHPQTVVRADRLAVPQLIEAVRAGRSWIAESAAVELRFDVAYGDRRYSVGDTVPARPGESLPVRLEARGVPGCVATVLGPDGPFASASADGSGRVAVDAAAPAGVGFVRAEIRRAAPPHRMVALTNPVYVAAS